MRFNTALRLFTLGTLTSLVACTAPEGVDDSEVQAASVDALSSCTLPAAYPSTWAEFDRVARCADNAGNAGNWSKAAVLKADGRYDWNEAYVMWSYVSLYTIASAQQQPLATSRYWLDKLVDHADAALRQRDDRTGAGLPDYQGRVGAVWQERVLSCNGSLYPAPQTPPPPQSCVRTSDCTTAGTQCLSGTCQGRGYVYAGFTGAITAPMARFARLVGGSPALQALTTASGVSYADKAREYAAATRTALAFHDAEWDASTNRYRFPTSLAPSTCPSIAGKEVPYNMGALAADAQKELALWDLTPLANRLGEAAVLNARHAAFETNFKDSLRSGWKYSTYITRSEDVGHANFDVQSAYFAFLRGVAFERNSTTEASMTSLTQTFSSVLRADLTVPFNLVNGTNHVNAAGVPDLSTSIFFWHYLGEFDPVMRDRSRRYVVQKKFPLLDLASSGYVRFVRGID